jgi:hypothetical protein
MFHKKVKMYQKGKIKEKIPFELHIILFLLPFHLSFK